MNNNKLDINKYKHFGFATYKEYFEKYGDVQAVEDAIIEDAKKYIELIRDEGYVYTLDRLMKLTDISNRTTIQTKFATNIKFVYIVKPVKNFLYVLLNEEKYYKQYQENLSGSYIDFLIDTESDDKILSKKIRDFYDINISDLKINKNFLRKKLFFNNEDLRFVIKEVFKVPKADDLGAGYKDIDDDYIDLIIKNGVKSQKTLVQSYNILGTTQFKRYVKSEKIPVDLKIVIPNDNENKRDMARYLLY